jgi:hypothetical protein
VSEYFSDTLFEAKWRDVSFPVTSFQLVGSHDLAQHKKPDQDGARIEATGRNPLQFRATIPFRNGATPAPSEHWGVLYPTTWALFIAAMADRATGTLQHPSFGKVPCKPVTFESMLSAQVRDGEDVTAEWIECNKDEDDSNNQFAGGFILASGVLECADLDTALTVSPIAKADPDNGKISFLDAITKITAVVDTASLLAQKEFGVIDRIVYRLDNLEFAIRSAGDPQNWPMKQSINRIRAALERIRASALATKQDISIYITPGATTLASLAPKLKTKVTDLIHLNPALVASARVEEQTLVRYYKAA